MPYTIDKYNGTTVAVVEDGTIDSTLDIKLIGKNYAGYGEVQNENLVHMLEHFAGASAPPRPIAGQIWYDSGNRKLKFYDSSNAKWKPTGGAESSSTAPAGLNVGDLWWDPTNALLYVNNGANYVLVGPQGIPGLGTTALKSLSVTDFPSGTARPIIAAYVNGKVIYVISSESDEFELSTISKELLGPSDPTRFGTIKPGITLAFTNNTTGITDLNSNPTPVEKANFWGTSSNALRLGGIDAADYLVNTGNVDFSNQVRFGDSGFVVGNSPSNRLAVFISGVDRIPVIQNLETNTIEFKTTSGTPLKLLGANVLPGADNTTDLGSSSAKFKVAYAANFNGSGASLTDLNATNLTGGVVPFGRLSGTYGISISGTAATASLAVTATNTDNLKVGSVYMTASQLATASTVVARTSISEVIDGTTIAAGSVKAEYFVGTATAALFADLAEKYLTDVPYDVGTVVMVGGDAEVTACTLGARAFGAVSANPAYMMNSGLEGGTYIALKGRIPVKVAGSVKKGDRLIAGDNGCAGVSATLLKNIPIRAGNFPDTFAIALETSTDEGVKLIEAIIL